MAAGSPRQFQAGTLIAFVTLEPDGVQVDNNDPLTAKECRRFAAWLIKAAEWLERPS